MKEWWLKLKEWWTHLAPREKQVVAVGAAILGIFIVYQGIWSPLMHAAASARKRLETNQQTLAWMQAAEKILQSKSANTQHKAQSISPVALLSVLQKRIQNTGLDQGLKQLKQASNDGVEMHFQKVDFDQLMRFLIDIAKENQITVTQFSAVAAGGPGVVNADVVVSIS